MFSHIYCKCIVNKNVKTNESLDTLNSKKDLRQADTMREHFKKFDIFTEEIVAVSHRQDECIADLDRFLQFFGKINVYLRLNQKRTDIIWSRDVELLAVECELIASANSLLASARALQICMCDFHRVLVVSKRKEDQMNRSVSDSRGFLLNRRSYLLSKFDFLFQNVLQPGSLTSVNLHLFVSERERRSFTSHFT